MQSRELSTGRVFILRLVTGDILHKVVEDFAAVNKINGATVSAVGGVGPGSKMIVGPKYPIEDKIEPLLHTLDAPHELTGIGSLFLDDDGNPLLHMHGSVGREGNSVTGCLRSGMIAWLVLEVTILEHTGNNPTRKTDVESGFKILEIN